MKTYKTPRITPTKIDSEYLMAASCACGGNSCNNRHHCQDGCGCSHAAPPVKFLDYDDDVN